MRNLRKRRIEMGKEEVPSSATEIDVMAVATISFSSESSEHPIEHMFDGHSGRGATRWVGVQVGKTEQVELAFDVPQSISRITFDAEELQHERRQEVRIEVSKDGGRKYRQILMQQYNFSPGGATYQHEEMQVDLSSITNLRLLVGGPNRQSLTALKLFR